ncbi:MAG: alpha/beta hydrolase [Candidimonas sp.]
MKKIYIHGANSSSISFNYIRHFDDDDSVVIDYNCNESSVNEVADDVCKIIKKYDNCALIGHSMGGVIAHSVCMKSPIPSKLITISSPFGGISVTSVLRYLYPTVRMYHDMDPMTIHTPSIASCAWLAIITTGGEAAWMNEPNDGVVTIRSQKFIKPTKMVESNLNHFEILLSDKTIECIDNFLLM